MNFHHSHHKAFSCAHTPKLTRWIPITFLLINIKRANSMHNCKWAWRLWVYTWIGIWCLDLDGGRIRKP